MTLVHDTASVHPRERMDYWREVVCERFVNLDVGVDAALDTPPSGFHARIESARFRSLQISRVVAPPQYVCRTPRRLLDDAGEHSIVMLQRFGRARLTQNGISGQLTAGAMGILDSGRPYRIDFPERFDQIVVKIPTEQLRHRLGGELPLAIGAATARGLLASRLLGTLTEAALGGGDQLPDERIEALAAEVMTMAFQPAGTAGDRSGSVAQKRVARARAFVADHLSDPGLSVQAVADDQGISPRLLQMHFARLGLRMSRLILDARLDACLASLQSGDSRRLSVTEIALAAGFSDPSHFARTFRHRFGVTATQVRRRV